MLIGSRTAMWSVVDGRSINVVSPLIDVNATGIDRNIEKYVFAGLLGANEIYVLVDIGDEGLPNNALITFETDDSALIKTNAIRYRNLAYNVFPVVSKASYDCVVRKTWKYAYFKK